MNPHDTTDCLLQKGQHEETETDQYPDNIFDAVEGIREYIKPSDLIEVDKCLESLNIDRRFNIETRNNILSCSEMMPVELVELIKKFRL